jgi:internalin A
LSVAGLDAMARSKRRSTKTLEEAKALEEARRRVAEAASRSANELNLTGLPISALPPEIGQLQSLQSLDLGSTKISELPPEIGQLQSLEVLDLSHTRISKLPPEIGRLQYLRALDLEGTEISALPQELGALDDALLLRLRGLALPEPYPDLVERGTPAVLAYLRSLADGQPQYEAKLMLVGEGEVGKSTLIRRLRGEGFAESLDTTHGIELGRLDLPHPNLDEEIRLNSWDFGGQEVYRILINSSSVVALCIFSSGSRGSDESKARSITGWPSCSCGLATTRVSS